jgi:hypothetical protein
MATKERQKEQMKRLFTRADAVERLGAQIFRDALAAGWIKARAHKAGRTKRRPHAKVIFALSDIEAVEERILNGEYPERPKPDWFGKAKAEPA